jgi:hypothetical protein
VLLKGKDENVGWDSTCKGKMKTFDKDRIGCLCDSIWLKQRTGGRKRWVMCFEDTLLCKRACGVSLTKTTFSREELL